ncbi:MAG: methyl-accepting chemotaxis protein [Lachnospiraceae bacterium]|nr:methyl-accepting chemotaxis protein [Lachnospiraceae bacterium]
MGKKKDAGSFGKKVLNFFVFLKDKIVEFFVFLKDKIVDLFDIIIGKRDYRFGIRYKILIGFLIPIVFIIVVGFASYSKAKQGMRDRFEKSTLETVRMVGSQMEMVTHAMQTEVSKYIGLLELNNLAKDAYATNPTEKTRVIRLLKTNVTASQKVNRYINNLYIILKSPHKNITTKGNNTEGFYDEYYESIETIDSIGDISKWIDSHQVIDEKLGLDTEADDAYLFAYQAVNATGDFAVVIDVSKSKLQEFIDGLDLGEGTIIGIITMNGKEIVHRNGDYLDADGRSVFAGRDYYKKVLTSDEAYGINEVEYAGEDCLLFYSMCGDGGVAICAMVPVAIITEEASSIRTLTVILLLIAVAVVLVIAFLISNNIQKNVKNMSKGLGKVAEGDLTVKVRVDTHDEFKDLAGATTEMISNTKNLVSKVDVAAEGLADSAKEVQAVSKTLSDRSSSISRAVNEMSEGLEQQQKYADECVDTTERLSLEIKNVSSQIGVIKKTIASINEMINESVRIAGSLEEKAKDTTEANHSVKKSVMALVEETEKINDFVNVIKAISSQTHLLSLNASIEAARAGEAGRGFSVVAEEIRNLATESTKSAGEIQKLVDGINRQTGSSAESVDAARSIADEQFELVNRSKSIFDSMKQSMDSLNAELGNIDTATEAADLRREEAVGAVGDISDIISQSTGNAENVKQILERLKKDIDNLDRTADKLGESMDGLKNEVRVFRI